MNEEDRNKIIEKAMKEGRLEIEGKIDLKASEFEKYKDMELVYDWIEVTQEKINMFAESTGDKLWLHTDPVRAKKESPFGGTIAHGFWTLSQISCSIQQKVNIIDSKGTIFLGLDNVRFPSPVLVGSRIRCIGKTKSLKYGTRSDGKRYVETTTNYRFFVEGVDEKTGKPCCVADFSGREFF